MNRTFPIAIVTVLLLGPNQPSPCSAAPIEIATIRREDSVDFEKEILPVFRRNCLACHSATEAQSDLILESPQAILKGGSQGPSIVPGQSAGSLLLKLASMQGEPAMPPPDNDVKAKPLTSQELGLLKLWIDQGAKSSDRSAAAAISWQPLPAAVNPIYSAAITADGQVAAAARANQVFLYHLPGKRELGRLIDPAIAERGIYPQGGVADLDLVQSLAFSPDGKLLASGGFRTVKLWQRPALTRERTLAADAAEALVLATSADGQLAAIADTTNRITVYEIATGKATATLVGHQQPVTALAFAPQSSRLISGSDDKSFRVWDLSSQHSIATVSTPSSVTAVALVASGRQVITGGADGKLRMWEVVATQPDSSAQPVREQAAHTASISSLIAFQVSGSERMATAGQDGAVRIWKVGSEKPLLELKQDLPIAKIAVSANGNQLVAVDSAGTAKLWNVADGKPVATLSGNITAALRKQDAARAAKLATRHVELAKKDLEDAKKRQTDEEENQKKAAEALTKAETEWKAKAEAAEKAAAEKSAAEKLAAESKLAKTTADEAQQNAEHLLATAEKARLAAEAGLAQLAKIPSEGGAPARLESEKVVAELKSLQKLLEPGKANATKAAQSAAEKLVADEKKAQEVGTLAQKATDDQTAAQRSLETAKRGTERALAAVNSAKQAIPRFTELVTAADLAAQHANTALAQATQAAQQPDQPIRGAAFLNAGELLVTVHGDGSWQTWDAQNGSARETFPGQLAGITNLTSATNGNLVTAGGAQANAVWQLPSQWSLVRTIGSPDDSQVFADRVTAVTFSPDGQTLAAGGGEPSRSGEVKLFSVQTGKLHNALQDPHSDTVNGLAFSPDGKQLASCAADRFMKLWNVADGKLVRSFEGHTHHVLGVSWRTDGRVLASSGADLVIKVWDPRSGDQLRTVQNQFTKEVTSIAFIADDIFVAAGGDAKLRAINATSGANQREFPGTTNYLYTVAASAAGDTIVAGGLDGVLKVWTAEGKEVSSFSPPPGAVSKTAAK